MAEGGKDPVWPMPTVPPKFATFSLGGGRPDGCAAEKCERWHAGIDLQRAPDKALVVAPEDGTIVGLDKGWTEGTRAIFFVTDSGLFLVLGGIITVSVCVTAGCYVGTEDPYRGTADTVIVPLLAGR